jgi:hypothetical protein
MLTTDALRKAALMASSTFRQHRIPQNMRSSDRSVGTISQSDWKPTGSFNSVSETVIFKIGSDALSFPRQHCRATVITVSHDSSVASRLSFQFSELLHGLSPGLSSAIIGERTDRGVSTF